MGKKNPKKGLLPHCFFHGKFASKKIGRGLVFYADLCYNGIKWQGLYLRHHNKHFERMVPMNKTKVKLSPLKIVAVVLIGLSLAFISFFAILTIIVGFLAKEKLPYLYGGYTPYRELLIIGICIVLFVLLLLFNLRIKRKWLSAVVNIIVIIALCNPYTLFFKSPGNSYFGELL